MSLRHGFNNAESSGGDEHYSAHAEAETRAERRRRKYAMLKDRSQRPNALSVNPESIPAEMRVARRWSLWRWEWRPERGEWSKVPKCPDGANAKSNDSATWCDYPTALTAYERGGFDGLGFMLGDGWVGIDVDICRDTETGALDARARHIVSLLDSYTEVSPTGSGLKIFVRGAKPAGSSKSRDNDLEMYDSGRYFTVTGARVNEV